MRKTTKITIGTSTYAMRQLGAFQGTAVSIAVLRLLGPAAAAGLSEGNTEAALLKAFSASANAKDVQEICEAFAAETKEIKRAQTTDGYREIEVPIQSWDEHFAGRYADLVAWIWEGVKLNFSDFFSGGSSFLESLRGAGTPGPNP